MKWQKCSNVMYYTVLYCTVLYSTLLYSTVLYSTVLYYRAKLQYKLLSQILCWRVEEAVQAVEEPKTLRFSSIIFCARYRLLSTPPCHLGK